MSKKNLHAEDLLNELKGNSSFFPTRQEQTPVTESASKPANLPTSKDVNLQESKLVNDPPSNQSSLHASINASKLASMQADNPDIIEIIRKIVKSPAKEEVLYVRVTKEEKNQLGDIEYTYDRQDIETSANELGRIAINFLIADYRANGEQSILAKVLTALHA
jgi:hypothetical protein